MQNSKRLCALFTKRLATNRIRIKQTFFSVSSAIPNNTKLITSTTSNNFCDKHKLSPGRLYHDDHYTDGEDDIDTIYQDQPKSVKYILYPNHDDPLLPLLNGCASIQEVFNFLKKYHHILQPMHLAQSVLVLWDLQKIFQHVTELTSMDKVEKLMSDYTNELLMRNEFKVLLELLEQNTHGYNADELSSVYIYLNKIGVPRNGTTMQNLFTKLCELMPNHDGLTALSKFMIAVNYNKHKEAYNMCKDKLSSILNKLETCVTSEDIKLISVCLNVLNKEITPDMLETYQNKLKSLLSQEIITAEDTDVLIKVILFLHYPQWRHKHAELLSKCILLLKPKISQLSLSEILVLNEVIVKTQEPANILFELQRYTAKLMRELEENDSTAYQKRLKLANSLIQLSAPTQRPESELMIRKYFLYPLNGKCLIELLKAMQYIKIMDPLFCKSFWDKMLTELEHDEEFKSEYMMKVCYLYMSCHKCLPYRHFKLEKRLNQWIEGLIETSPLLEDTKNFISVASFVIPYGNDVSIINYITNMFRDNWERFGPLDCAGLARGLHIGKNITKNVHLKDRYYSILCNTSDKIIEKVLEDRQHDEKHPIDVNITNVLMKSYVYRNKMDHSMVDKLLLTYKDDTYLSSKQIRNLTMCLLLSSALLPGIIDRMVDYVCKCKESIMAFNAEKVAFLCYYLGYIPKKSEVFSKILVDLILRDQEKINGLSYLQSCLALCFFNNMTSPLIKQIFNVHFMEKLDLELKHCYAKDVYPSRVRQKLMQLNRTVCIDYPELNIPWFHQKFVQQSKHVTLSDPSFLSNVENYLNKIFYDCDIETNTLTPYGYNVDFTISYKDDNDSMIKLGILLTKSKHYTRINSQLKGAMQTKIRHIEMLGYKVKLIFYNDWNCLVYAEDKIAYIRNLLNLPSRYPKFYYQINNR